MMASEWDLERIRKDFPLLQRGSHGHRLVYLDSAATSQRPETVLDAMTEYYNLSNANVHRGVYELAEESTERYEAARRAVGRFINAPAPAREIVFTKNATEAFNLLASSLSAGPRLANCPAIVLTTMEHHANLVPWLMVADRTGAELRYLDFDANGQLILDNLDRLLDGAAILAVTLASNVLGTLNDLDALVQAAHRAGALVVADAAQYVPHHRLDVARLGVDFLAFSGHKMLGPTGIGVLWGRQELLEVLPPFLGGGEMITDVRLDGFEPNEIPWRFEAGTPPIAEAIGLEAACAYLNQLGLDGIDRHCRDLTTFAHARILEEFGDLITVHGPAFGQERGPLLSLAMDGVHPHDLAQVLDESGVCVRAGHHCAKPLMRKLGLVATTRASFYLYNGPDDVEALLAGLARARNLFAAGVV